MFLSEHKLVYLELDGLRGTAFLMVLIGHIFAHNPQILPYIVGVPKMGVWMFFVLSSFLLSNYFLSKPERVNQPVEWLNYLIRRFMRIYPLYTIVLLIYYFWHHDINSIYTILNHILLQEGYIQFWTIPVEMTFYLILPLIILIIVRICRMNVKHTMMLTVAFMVLHQIFYPFTKAVESSTNIMQYLPVFMYGVIGALIHQKLLLVEISIKQKTLFDGLAVVTALCLVLVTPYPMDLLFGHEPDKYLVNKYLFIGFACFILIISIIHGRLIKRFFSYSVMRFFGKISYGGYLIHWMFVQMFFSYFFKGLTFVSGTLTFLLTVSSATIFYYAIERPSMKVNLLKRKSKKQISLTAQ